jgi:hypothetical protein
MVAMVAVTACVVNYSNMYVLTSIRRHWRAVIWPIPGMPALPYSSPQLLKRRFIERILADPQRLDWQPPFQPSADH